MKGKQEVGKLGLNRKLISLKMECHSNLRSPPDLKITTDKDNFNLFEAELLKMMQHYKKIGTKLMEEENYQGKLLCMEVQVHYNDALVQYCILRC